MTASPVAGDSSHDDDFGYALSIDGDTIAIGARDSNDRGSASGSVYIFVRSGTNWVKIRKLTAADGVSGDMFGHSLQGITELIGKCNCKVHAQKQEAPWIQRVTGCSASDLHLHDSGDVLKVGGTRTGARAYLCVAGGFESSEVLGSRSALAAVRVDEVGPVKTKPSSSLPVPAPDSTIASNRSYAPVSTRSSCVGPSE